MIRLGQSEFRDKVKIPARFQRELRLARRFSGRHDITMCRAPGEQTEDMPCPWLTPGRFGLLAALMFLVLYPDVLLGRSTFFYRDFGIFAYPLAFYHRECFWSGELPLWNPYNGCGMPFLAQWNTLTLYPLSLIYLLLPLPWSLNLFSLFHLWLGAMGMYFLAWHATRNRLAAGVAGVAFAFNGMSLNCLMWTSTPAAWGWMPWVALCAQRGWREGGRWWLLAVLVGTLQMLTGAPEVILLTWVFCAVWLAGEMMAGPGWRAMVPRFAGMMVGVGIAASIQLLPFVDLLLHSQRDRDFGGSGWSMPGWGWANFLVPLFHCYASSSGVFSQNGIEPQQQWTSSYYAGIGTLAIAVYALWQVRRWPARYLGGMAGLSVILALGPHGYLYSWLRQGLPVLGFMRFPVKYVVLANFCLPLLAAYGTAEMTRVGARAGKESLIRWGVVGLVLTLLLAAVVEFQWLYPFPGDSWPAVWRNGLSREGFLLLLWGVCAALGWNRALQHRSPLGGLLLGLLWADVATHAPSQNPVVTSAALHPDLQRLNPHPGLGVSRVRVDAPAFVALNGHMLADPFNDLLCHRLGEFSNLNLLDHLAVFDGFYPLMLREWAHLERWLVRTPAPGGYPRLDDFLGISHMLADPAKLQYTNRPSVMPLITSGQAPLFMADAQALAAMISQDFKPRDTVLLAQEAKAQIQVAHPGQAKVLASHWSRRELSVKVEATEPSLIVIAQSFHSGWRATVDGLPVRLYKANYAFQALETPAGRHRVQLRYVEPWLGAGAWCSGCALGVWLFFWVRFRPAAAAAEGETSSGAHAATTASRQE